ncbi:beta-galactosidase [Polaribacter reichenbachii]|uniref:beta-galactosidase n=1 Tax=Polaribacter reichenbachii TaxID=996801 RepID=A0A1B8U6R7_9FLAO|nr:glycoside hydrolase family 2 TIM barrel-domain containing protein [Polaribacter reichenbachii]APZ46075.1 beta-galactosidase [Polaribacter reichenbachii]AUC19937.1 beta-galactosidase [Polaribacter reichenbachii]OBY67519.1 beta-galactosidase [Polaribacter reichenbachii]
MEIKRYLIIFITLFFSITVLSQKTEIIYLSGKDFKNPVQWDFMCTNGMNSKKWTTINIPSNWELQGFGEYTYGRWYKELNQKEPSKEEGFYKYQFKVPKDYKDKNITIVFGGAMTDTQVKINGKSAGEIHQGGFYEFKYDITSLVNFDKINLLEVHVAKHSSNKSVNAAERKTDWWLFGGIYRPVWLEISPKSFIKHIAVNAKMDGSLSADINFENIPKNPTIEATIVPVNDDKKHETKTIKLKVDKNFQKISTKWKDVNTWDPENPNMYTLNLSLKNNGKTIHTYSTKIGFRTLKFLKKDGIYLNDKKIIMKGISRHSIWPESGRSTDKSISILDVNLLKDMNINAVRFHYPVDKHFLEVCDSLGLLVLNELAGWQNGYDTKTGKKLIKETVQRDVNHPSVIIWDHGNEGGWNEENDAVFHQYDPQKRIVIHPWADFNGWDTHHYPTYLTGMHRFNNGENVFFPTEFMHGTYDNGIGAGLEDFWNRYKKSPLFAGAFIWTMLDEAVLRTDWKGEKKYDSKGNLAPDGVLGPHREKEGSFFAVKEIWSPIQFKPKKVTSTFDGSFLISNEYLFTNLSECKFEYRVLKTDNSVLYTHNKSKSIASKSIKSINIEPGETRKIKFDLPTNFFEGDWLEIKAYDKFNREIYTWTWPIHEAKYFTKKLFSFNKTNNKVSILKPGSKVILNSNSVSVSLDVLTGLITNIKNKKGNIPFKNGPKPIGMKAKVLNFKTEEFKDSVVCTFNYSGGIDHAKWTLFNDGRLKLKLILLKNAGRTNGFDGAFFEGQINKFGVTFDFPEEGVTSFKWLGNGPYRVWKNRIPGTEFGLWEKSYNKTITGESFENLVYPEFKGYHANFIAGNLKTETGNYKFFSENDHLFFRLFTPDLPKNSISKTFPQPKFPTGNISFMYEIPAMRAFKPIEHQGPESQPTNIRIKKGDDGIPMTLWFDFRNN